MKRIIPIIILIAVLGGGYYWYTNRISAVTLAPAGLVGSGAIEAETVAITAELGGRIVDIKVAEGDEVAAGQVLVQLDQADLLAQQAQFEAAVASARANLALVSALALPQDVAAAQAQLAQTQIGRDGAKVVWNQAKTVVDNPHELETRVNQGKARIAQAEAALEEARVALKRAEIQAEAAGRSQNGHMALVQAEAAQKKLDAAQLGVQMAEVALAGSAKQVEHLTQMRLMPLSLIVQAHTAEAAYLQTEAAVQAAQANLNAVKAAPTAQDVAVAQAQVLEAEAALAAVEVQLAKQTLTAPRAGLVSRRLAEPGELAALGTMLLELSDLETVDLTVYIPVTRLGEVKLGRQAHVFADAFAGQVFEGVVSFIAHEAEFTPRNVQTQEERVNLVFAVKITLNNADHRLKPGMPADAEILPTMAPVTAKPSPARPAIVTPWPTATPVVAALPTPALTPAAGVPSPAAATTPVRSLVEVLAWALAVRAGPGPDYPAVAHLSQGQVVPVLAVDPPSGWLQVELPGGQTGWITGSPTYVAVR
jgi:multidrug resistance efflux pump